MGEAVQDTCGSHSHPFAMFHSGFAMPWFSSLNMVYLSGVTIKCRKRNSWDTLGSPYNGPAWPSMAHLLSLIYAAEELVDTEFFAPFQAILPGPIAGLNDGALLPSGS